MRDRENGVFLLWKKIAEILLNNNSSFEGLHVNINSVCGQKADILVSKLALHMQNTRL
jgi:hypothetical protein